MQRRGLVACLFTGFFTAAAWAQNAPLDVSKLPDEIRSLPWKSIDPAALGEVERCRALLLMNDAVDELHAQSAAEADLLSEYIDTHNLGDAFAAQPPVPDASPVSMDDGLKMAAALLRGPMSGGPYASAMSDAAPGTLAAYEQMYRSSCQRKWAAMTDSRLQVRSMMRYLQTAGKLDDYIAWVPGAVAQRTRDHDAEVARRRAAQAAQQQQQAQDRLAQEQARLQQEQQQLQQQRQATQQMQQSMIAAAQQAGQAQNQAPPPNQGYVVNSGYPDWYYGGAVALGAGAWYRDAAYRGAATARTDARMNAWHGARGRR